MIYHLAHFLFPKLYFRGDPCSQKTWYLTFDDGPTPEITDWVLELLKSYDAKATFFCVGHQAEKYPNILAKIIEEGHTIGNHTYSHINSWKVSNDLYYEDILKANLILQSNLFRPPYGKLTLPQYFRIKKNYKIILWSKIAEDWNQTLDPLKKVQNMIANAQNGDIFLLHDSSKAFENLKIMLPNLLQFAQKNKIVLSSLA